MSDVEAGGATVFPYVGARVMPKKVGKHIDRWFVHLALKLKPSIVPKYETLLGAQHKARSIWCFSLLLILNFLQFCLESLVLFS